ncbi:MAG: 3-methyladenine DNA glycosylase [Gemmatimonadales bacterium]|jgi:hypothetical protein|nr:3-methyladenine DNA glycosylase [Gemmatimonadales bacterium]MBT7124596.1 3-methyladenine DNA glycosylase [Gemmatimonadales bacterium]
MHDVHLTEPAVLTAPTWIARARAHRARVRVWTGPHKERRSRREKHPVYDFLFQYYMYSAAKLEAWHPNAHEAVADSPEARELFRAPAYQTDDGAIRRDPSALTEVQMEALRENLHVLEATQEKPPNFGCFGVHEWAMVYRGHDIRHAEIAPLRLPQKEVDAFVESRPVACSHFDAFRFFAPEAKPLNRIDLEWKTRHEMEQPGCIHANMDLYRWAYASMPWIGSDLLWDSFELATELRVLDMQATPYDLSSLGFEPVRVETPEGRSEYQSRQRALAARAEALRSRLIATLESVLSLRVPSENPAFQ